MPVKRKSEGGLFKLDLAPYIRRTPNHILVNVSTPLGDSAVLHYTSTATINGECAELLAKTVSEASAQKPRPAVDIADALSRSLPSGSFGSVEGEGFRIEFVVPETNQDKGQARKGRR